MFFWCFLQIQSHDKSPFFTAMCFIFSNHRTSKSKIGNLWKAAFAWVTFGWKTPLPVIVRIVEWVKGYGSCDHYNWEILANKVSWIRIFVVIEFLQRHHGIPGPQCSRQRLREIFTWRPAAKTLHHWFWEKKLSIKPKDQVWSCFSNSWILYIKYYDII